LTNLTDEERADFNQEFDALKAALRAAGIKIYEFCGFDKNHDSMMVSDYDISCVEAADLVLAICTHPSTGTGIEIGWACAKQQHVITAGKKGVYVSHMPRGMQSRNPNHSYVEYETLLDLVPMVVEHFAKRPPPEVSAPGLEKFLDPETRQPLFRQRKYPVAT
jgi:nucleoside 2-deoxyribosyltransferase